MRLYEIPKTVRNRLVLPFQRFLRNSADLVREKCSPTKDPDIIKATVFLRERISALPSLDDTSYSPADKKWLDYRREIRHLIRTRDPYRFLTWEPIRCTMFLEREYEEVISYLTSQKDWGEWLDALKESPVGNPKIARSLPASPTLTHHAYSLIKFLRTTDTDLNNINSTLEIGGGYGSMCRLFINKDFRGTYFMLDLPEFSELQRFFLSLTFPQKDLNRVIVCSETREVNVQPDLIIAMWSISEMSEEKRNELMGIYKPRYYLIGYQKKFAGVDNDTYFRDFMRNHSEYEWTLEELPHIPSNYHLFGKLKS